MSGADAADRRAARAGATTRAIADVRDLHVSFGGRDVVSGVGLRLEAGQCVALVGQSGSGKSVTARALVGLCGPGSRVAASTLDVCGHDMRGATPRQWRRVRGSEVGLVLQDALVSLDPLRPVCREIDDTLRLHTRLGLAARRARVLQALRDAGIPDPERRAGQRAGELSGGLRQRALIAAAIVLRPPLVIADEPTTALDVAVQRHVLDTLGRLRDDGTAVLLISHDLSVVSAIADRVHVMHDGRVVEEGPTADVLARPQHPYTRRLLAAVPAGRPRGVRLGGAAGDRPGSDDRTPTTGEPLLELHHVSRTFGRGADARRVVDDVSLTVYAGRTLGLVGESGSGKTTTARIALGLVAPDAGRVAFRGAPWAPAPERDRRALRRHIGAIYQDPFSSFDPRWSVGGILADALTGGASRSPRRHADAVTALLASVGLDADTAARNPRSLSGGQRQRVAIARAIAPRPDVLICDEPVASLDVLVQAQILDLLDDLQRDTGVGYLFISHDLDVVRHMSDTIAVMRDGRIIDRGDAAHTLAAHRHPELSLVGPPEGSAAFAPMRAITTRERTPDV